LFKEKPPVVTGVDGKPVPLAGLNAPGKRHPPADVNLGPGNEVELAEWKAALRPASDRDDENLNFEFLYGTGTFGVQYEQVLANSSASRIKIDPALRKLATGKLDLEVKEAKKREDKEQENGASTAWGKEIGGLQAGLGFRPGEKRAYHHGEALTLVVRVRNVGKEAVKFQYLSQFFIETPPTVTDGDGKPIPVPLGRVTAFGIHLPVEVNLAPGKETELYEWKPRLRSESDEEMPNIGTLYGTGKFLVQYERVFGNSSSGSIKIDPALSKLATGKLELEIKTAEEREKPPQSQDDKSPGIAVSERTAEPLLKADRPWEDFCLSISQVLREGDKWHLWYIAYDHNYRSDADCYVCYARSTDGVRWEKPALGLYKYGADKDNNILLAGSSMGSVFLDEKGPRNARFKATGVRLVKGEWWVYGGTSADGLRWEWQPLLKHNSDTANVCFRDGDTYRLYSRIWTSPPFGGKRVIGYSESKVFGDFPKARVILAPDEDDPKDLHFYSSAATKLKEGLYLMLFSGFTTGDGAVRVHAAWSRNGQDFRRISRKPLLELGKGFDSKGLYVGPGGVPGEKAGTYWFYYSGTQVAHDENVPTKVKSDGGMGRFLLQVTE
jgi:hypothetical protein